AERVGERARDAYECARRPAGEGARHVRRGRALRADAGQEQDGLREEPPGLADAARMGGADDGADAREPAVAEEVLAPRGDQLADLVPERPSVGERQVLDVAARIRRLQ